MILNRLKHAIRDLTRYPSYHSADSAYETYWKARDVHTHLNSFQAERARMLTELISDRDSILDVGCGDGRILKYVKEHASPGRLLGIDFSPTIIDVAKQRGIEVVRGDVRDPNRLPIAEHFDHVVLFEVLEHVEKSEELLSWAFDHADKSVVFSVPNTGYIFHRLRLLFGKFPLQWKAHPGEHLRFWTMTDMRWWLTQLGYRGVRIMSYEGIPLLNKLWPSLFAAGQFVVVRKN